MSDKVGQFTDAIRQRIFRMETQLEGVMVDIHADMKNDKKDLDSKIKAASLLVHRLQRAMIVAEDLGPKSIEERE